MRIVIVGGGTSGWMTAAAFCKTFPNWDITMINGGDAIGVGKFYKMQRQSSNQMSRHRQSQYACYFFLSVFLISLAYKTSSGVYQVGCFFAPLISFFTAFFVDSGFFGSWSCIYVLPY